MPSTSISSKFNMIRGAARFAWRAVSSRYNPLLAQVVVTRHCNLSCGYCNEYDDFSPPVPLPILLERIDALARLKTAAVTLTGGEALLHPELHQVIARIRAHGMIATMITNGFRLSKKRILQLNEAGLQEMQISIDNLEPDDVSMKSLRSVERKLELLARYAQFKVNINSVLGVSDERTNDVLTIAQRATHYHFYHSIGVVHDGNGILKPLTDKQRAMYHHITANYRSLTHRINHRLFQGNLVAGNKNDWKCRAGARYLYICEDGLVHWCSQRRGYPGIPVTAYSLQDIQREFDTEKKCSPRCTLSCVHQMSAFDRWRGRQSLPDPQGHDAAASALTR